MKKSTVVKALASAGAVAGSALLAKNKFKKDMEDPEKKKKALDLADRAVMKVVKGLANGVSANTIPYLNRYDNSGFMEGSGYLLEKKAANAHWSLGYAKADIIPENQEGDWYLGGYLAFPPNKVTGRIDSQFVRAIALDDGSKRGINVFAVIDCVGLSNNDIRQIRLRLKDIISEKNIVSINISATHCHSGVDTMGLWGDLIGALKTNLGAVKKEKTLQNVVSGRNKAFMENLYQTASDTIRRAVEDMTPGKLEYNLMNIEKYVRDKRPPYITDNTLTAIRFIPRSAKKKKVMAVIMAAHPTCLGFHNTEISADYPYYLCDELEKSGYRSMFFQGAELAVAERRGDFASEGQTKMEVIENYGRLIAKDVADIADADFKAITPLLNVRVRELFLPSLNPILEFAGKLRVVSNQIVKVAPGDSDKYELYFSTEVGMAQFGEDLYLALIPGECAPELVLGGTFTEEESYTGTAFKYPPMNSFVNGRLSVIGLCNDEMGYIVPDNDFGSVFAPLHYEEAVSAGPATASNIVGAFIEVAKEFQKLNGENT